MRWRSFILLACLSMVGCSTVSSKSPLGDPVAGDVAKKLEGIWLSEGEPLLVKHINDNELRLASIEWAKDEAQFKMEELTAFVTQDEDRYYVNLMGLDAENAPKEFTFARLTGLEGESLVMILP